MRQSQSNYANMAKAVCDVLNTHKELWQTQPLIVSGVDRLNILCTDVAHTASLQQQNNATGHTASKEQARNVLANHLFTLGNRLKTYALLEEDEVARAQVKFSRSSLDSLSLSNLLSLARAVLDTCKIRTSSLEPYLICEAELHTLQTDIDRVVKLNAHRDAVTDHRMENTSHLTQLFTQLRKELKLMDAMIDAYMEDETFLTVYFNARRIHDVKGGGGSKKIDNVFSVIE